MKFKFKYLDEIVGTFIVVFFLILVVAVLAIARGKGWLTQYRKFVLTANSTGGVAVGTDVLLENQLKVGNVQSIKMGENNRVEMGIRIEEQYADRIRADTKAAIRGSLLSGSKIYLSMGSVGQPEREAGSHIDAQSEGGFLERLPQVLEKTEKAMEEAFEGFSRIKKNFDKLEVLLDKLNDEDHGLQPTLMAYKSLAYDLHQGKGFFANMVRDEELYPAMRQSARRLDPILVDIEATTQDVRKFGNRLGPLTDQLEQSLSEVNGMARSVRSTAGRAGPLLDEAGNAVGEGRQLIRSVGNSLLFSNPQREQPEPVMPGAREMPAGEAVP